MYTYDEADRLVQVNLGETISTNLAYDYAGRKTKMDDADMGLWRYEYNALGELKNQWDGRGCQTSLGYDLAGRLLSKTYDLSGCLGVGTTNPVVNEYDSSPYRQEFASWPASGWVKAGNVTTSGGYLRLVGNGTWGTTYARRTVSLLDGEAVRVRFRTSNASEEANLMVELGTWGQSDYRRWALKLGNGSLSREHYQGTTISGPQTLMSLKANTWYEAVLGMEAGANASLPRFRVVVWEKDNPSNWKQDVVSFSAQDWSRSEWKFQAQVKTSVQSLDLEYELEYDDGALGQRTKMVDGSGSATWLYTTRGSVQQESKKIDGSSAYVSQWVYNSAGLLARMIYPDGEALSYTYHPQGTLNSLQSSLGGVYYVHSSRYDAAGRLTQRRLGGASNLLNQLSYFLWDTPNGQGRLQRITAGTDANPALLLDQRYLDPANGQPGYDALGNLEFIQDYIMGSPQVQSFEYDGLNRLTSAQASGGTGGVYGPDTYGYDSLGRLSLKSDLGELHYNDPDHPHAATHIGMNLRYAYDLNGNLTWRQTAQGMYSLSYDAENRLVGVSGSAAAVMKYDGDGRRVKSEITLGGNTTTTRFVGNYYEDVGGTITKTYYAGASRVAVRSSSGVKYLFGDHPSTSLRTGLGSTSVSADSSGGNVTRQLYTAWGETRYSSGSLPTRYTYTGQYSNLADFGLLFYNARWYDPDLGRWAQADTVIPDPGNPADYDRFGYVRNNPVKFSDPTGYFSEDEIKKFLGFKKEDPWEEVLKLFEKGGKYEGRWGWLETLRRAEVGDQITIEWPEGVLPDGHPGYDDPLTFELDPNGDLILTGDGYYISHEIAGLYGDNYDLLHFTDLSAVACSPYECSYTTNFSTSAIHDPYLHTLVKWDELANNWLEAIHVAEMAGATAFTAAISIAIIPAILSSCLTPVSCAAGLAIGGPIAGVGGYATFLLAKGTLGVFQEHFIVITP